MLQRIQTVYLLIVVILTSITLFSVQAMLLENATQYLLNFKGIFRLEEKGLVFVQNVWALTALCTILPTIALTSILMYKKRLLQIRLSILNTVLLAGYYGMLFLYLWQAANTLRADWHLQIVAAFPLISIILTFLAIRAIGKDEALVKSLDRLR